LLEATDKRDDLLGIREPEDGITDQLARTVKGDVATAIDLVEFGSYRGKCFRRYQQVRPVAIATDGVNRTVLQKQQIVIAPPLDASLPQGAL
jgi:hypothetical protein